MNTKDAESRSDTGRPDARACARHATTASPTVDGTLTEDLTAVGSCSAPVLHRLRSTAVEPAE
jgi:hypothetical protein